MRQRTTVQSTTQPNLVTVANTIGSGYDDHQHIKGFAVTGAPAAGDTAVTLVTSGFASRFSRGDDVLIGDGPGINEFYGEWVKVVDVSGSVIAFDPPLRQDYENNLACIVPGWLNPLTGRRQHMTDIVIRDLSVCAPKAGDFAGVFGVVRGGVRIRFENVGFIASVNGPSQRGCAGRPWLDARRRSLQGGNETRNDRRASGCAELASAGRPSSGQATRESKKRRFSDPRCRGPSGSRLLRRLPSSQYVRGDNAV